MTRPRFGGTQEPIATAYTGNICWQVQEAARLFMLAADLSTVDAANIHKGLDSYALKTPRVVLRCTRASKALENEILWDAELDVIVRTNADDETEDQHAQRVAEVFSWWQSPEAVTIMSAAVDSFNVSQVLREAQVWDIEEGQETGRTWVSVLRLRLRCCSTTIAD